MNQLEENTDQVTPEEGWTPKDAFLAVAAFAVIIGLVIGGYFFYQSRKAPPVDIGTQAPEFTYEALGGGTRSLSDYRGKVVLLNVWATWCNPCREEMPSMERLYQSMKGQPFEIVAVSIDVRGAVDVDPFAKQLGLTFPILLDHNKEVSDLYQTTGVPESFIIDKNGTVAERIIGPLDWANTRTEQYQLIQHLMRAQ